MIHAFSTSLELRTDRSSQSAATGDYSRSLVALGSHVGGLWWPFVHPIREAISSVDQLESIGSSLGRLG